MKNGAKLAKEYDEQTVTHVLSDLLGENTIAKSLGYNALSDVPLDTPLVSYTWATECVNVSSTSQCVDISI